MHSVYLAYSVGFSFSKLEGASNKYEAESALIGFKDIQSYSWVLTNLDTTQVIDISSSQDWFYTFSEEGNYSLKLIVVDSILGSVDFTKEFQIIGINSNFYIIELDLILDGNVSSRGATKPYFYQGSTPTFLCKLKNYDYNSQQVTNLDIENLDIFVKFKKLKEFRENISDTDATYVKEYNSASNSSKVQKLIPYSAGEFKVNFNTTDTDVEGEIIFQTKVKEDNIVVKTIIVILEVKKAL